MEDSEVETGGALRRGMQLMNRAMMRPDNAAAAGDDYKDASDAEAELASTDEVMVDLVQRNIAVMEGKYISTSSSSTSSSSSATDVSSGSVAGPSAAEATAAESPAAAAAAAAKKRKSSGGGGGRDVRREQSLGHLSAVFVQMFLANDARVVSLEEAARWLLRSNLQQQSVTDSTQQQQLSDPDEQMTASKDHQSAGSAAAGPSSSSPASGGPLGGAENGKAKDKTASLFKSKVRRLYDIANVLSSLKLIEKIQLIQSRRPAFRWLGAAVYPLHSTINDEAYTRDGPNKSKSDGAANKRRTPSKQDSSAAVLRLKQEGAASADNGSADANGALSQTLHSAFSTPGSLAPLRTQPLSFSFTKQPASVITSTGPSLSHVPGSANVPSSSSSSLSSFAQPSSTSSLPGLTVSSFPSKANGGSGGGGGVYWIVNHDRSFSMDVSKMAADFEPLDFAYLPYISPPGLHSILAQQQRLQSEQQTTESSGSGSLPPHVAELSPAVQAAYVRDTAGFVSAFSAACKRWIQLIPEMAQQQQQQQADKRTNGSAKAAPSAADTVTANKGSSSVSSFSPASTSAPGRVRRSNARTSGGSSSKVR